MTFRRAIVAALIVNMVSPPSVFSGDIFKAFRRKSSIKNSPMVELAKAIDEIEEEIDDNGSIVVKQPDVWGEARWTAHREEYEKVMAEQLGKFQQTINARISEADSAFLLNASTLGRAIAGGTPVQPSAQTISTVFGGDTTPKFETITQDIQPKTVDQEKIDGVSIEPVTYLNQLSRYLKHLHQLRRINEGDDTADAPGYALNLMRVPVSILPGDETRKGHGAEVSITLSHENNRSLLPDVFRDLVVNDIVDELTLPVLQFANAKEVFCETIKRETQKVEAFRKLVGTKDISQVELKAAGELAQELVGTLRNSSNYESSQANEVAIQFRKSLRGQMLDLRNERAKVFANEKELTDAISAALSGDKPEQFKDIADDAKGVGTMVENSKTETAQKFAAQIVVAQLPSITGTRLRRARFPVAPSQLVQVFGRCELECLGDSFRKRRSGIRSQTEYFDASAYLGEELDAAYEFLSKMYDETGYDPWTSLCPEIARAVRLLRYSKTSDNGLEYLRGRFEKEVVQAHGSHGKDIEDCTIHALAWAILVESALLNETLKADIERVSNQTEEHIPASENFFGHKPSILARDAFCQYVEKRWPIHVFALDPVRQDQNVEDAFSRRRETQLALALAFTTGRTSAQNFQRFARRVDFDLETISLNRTVVGFSHGEDTFGWRFYPRVQAPPIRGNAEVKFRELITGPPSRDRDMRSRKLEAGQRELLAVVIMPSFVQHLRMDVRTNWFELTDQNEKRFTTEDSVRIGGMIQHARQVRAHCLTDGRVSREGETKRLLRSLDQLEKRLPLQNARVQVPYENLQGGIQLFAGGTRHLAPELRGFFGSRDVNAEGSEIFLAGRNFNLNHTRVLIDGKNLSEIELLSRELIKVTIPAGVKSSANGFEITVATPYGVSAALPIPVARTNSGNIPELTATVGLDAIDMAKGGTVFLKGQNFDSANSRVIANGVVLTDVTVLSDNLLQATIPANPGFSGTELKIQVGTPVGVSDHVKLPVTQAKKAPQKKVGAPVVHQVIGSAVNTKGDSVLHISGENFAADETIVMAGNALLPNVTVLSPKILQVTVPAKTAVDQGQIVFRVITKNGVSRNVPFAAIAAAAPTSKVPKLGTFIGGPYINVREGTTLFLTGENFDPKATSVIAGGLAVEEVHVISPKLLQVTVPKNPAIVGGKVFIHVATPEGATSPIQIPATTQQSVYRFDNSPETRVVVSQTSQSGQVVVNSAASRHRLRVVASQTGLDPEASEVAFFARLMANGQQVARVPVGPFNLNDGNIQTTAGAMPLSVDTILNAEFRSGKSLRGVLAERLRSGNSVDAVVLEGFVREPRNKEITRIDGSFLISLEKAEHAKAVSKPAAVRTTGWSKVAPVLAK